MSVYDYNNSKDVKNDIINESRESINIFYILENDIQTLLRERSNDYINKFIEKNNIIENLYGYDDIRDYEKKICITVSGYLSSGKSLLLDILLNKIKLLLDKKISNTVSDIKDCSLVETQKLHHNIPHHKIDLIIKHIQNIDIYNEKNIFDDIILFMKLPSSKKIRKILVIDDYCLFSELFKSKINSFMKNDKNIHMYIIIGENINNSININTSNISFISEQLCNKYKLLFTENEYEVFKYITSEYEENNNIVKMFNTLKILKFADISQLYTNMNLNYNSVFENINMTKNIISYLKNKESGNLCNILLNKYNNNENIRDVVLIIESVIYKIINKQNNITYTENTIEEYDDERIYKILNICSKIKNVISVLKSNNAYINYKLLFCNFIFLIKLV
jgi:hypothetical protein